MNCQIYIHTILIFISGDGGYAWEQHGDRRGGDRYRHGDGDGGDRYSMVVTGMVVLMMVSSILDSTSIITTTSSTAIAVSPLPRFFRASKYDD